MGYLKKVRRHYKSVCVYCEGFANTADHLIPKSRGGGSRITNLRPACEVCNQAKGNRTPEEWLADDCPGDLRDEILYAQMGDLQPQTP